MVCKQLGCGPAQPKSAGTQVSQDHNYIFLEGLQCRGGESLLLECQQNKVGPGLCQHRVAASVVCTEPRGECIKRKAEGGRGEKPKGWMLPFDFKRRAIKVVAHACQSKLSLGGYCLSSTMNPNITGWNIRDAFLILEEAGLSSFLLQLRFLSPQGLSVLPDSFSEIG